MATINLTQPNTKKTTLAGIATGKDFRLANQSMHYWLGTKVDIDTVVLYTDEGIEVCTLPLTTKVTPMFINLTITSSEVA